MEMTHFEPVPRDDRDSPNSSVTSSKLGTTLPDDQMEALEDLDDGTLKEIVAEEIQTLPDTHFGNSTKLLKLPFGLPTLIFPSIRRSFCAVISIFVNFLLRMFFFTLINCLDRTSYLSLGYMIGIVNRVHVFFFIVTLLIDPGYVKRAPTPSLVRKYTGITACGKCMTIDKDYRKWKNIIHCEKCDRCILGFDHHCGVLGTCIGKNNLIAFNIMVVTFALQMGMCYLGLYMSFTATNEMCEANKYQPKDFGVDVLLRMVHGASLNTIPEMLRGGHHSSTSSSGN